MKTKPRIIHAGVAVYLIACLAIALVALAVYGWPS
jgi:hypothetical protein